MNAAQNPTRFGRWADQFLFYFFRGPPMVFVPLALISIIGLLREGDLSSVVAATIFIPVYGYAFGLPLVLATGGVFAFYEVWCPPQWPRILPAIGFGILPSQIAAVLTGYYNDKGDGFLSVYAAFALVLFVPFFLPSLICVVWARRKGLIAPYQKAVS